MLVQAVGSLILLALIFTTTFHLEIKEMGILSNVCALLVVFGGTFATTLIAYPLKKMVETFRLLVKTFTSRDEIHGTIEHIVRMAQLYRKDGIRVLDQEERKLPAGLLKTGIGLIGLNYSRADIEQILAQEVRCLQNQHETSYKMLYNMARIAPALGLAGTIISLIRVFGHISDPQNLIGYMAVALLSTFYGVILANICLLPLSNKVREYIDQNELRMDLIQEGILDLCDRDHPRAIRYKLETLSAPMDFSFKAPAQPRLVRVSSSSS